MVARVAKIIGSKIGSLSEAAFWLSLFALFSQILALLRDRLLAHHFGAGQELDIYYAAFKIPDLIFVTVASLVSISALVPLLAKKETEGERHLKEASSSIFTVFSGLIIFFCAIFFFLTPHLVPRIFGGSPYFIEQTIRLSRILLLSPLLLGFSNFFGSIVQYEKRFILYSLSPFLYNLGIIFGIVFGVESYGLSAVAWGVIGGAFLHLILQAGFVLSSHLSPKLTLSIKWKDVLETASLSVPRTLALSVSSFVGFIFVAFAGRLGEGSIAVFNLAFNLQSAPLSLIGVSFSLAAFPALALSVAKNHLEDVVAKISDGLRYIIFWSLPFTSIIIILRAHIVRVVLGSGAFDWSDTRLTAATLALFVISAVFQSIQLFISRSHYALGKTKWPLLANILGGILSIVSYLLFKHYFISLSQWFSYLSLILNVSDLPPNILLLPLAFSIGSATSAILLFVGLGQKLCAEIWFNVRTTLGQSLVGALSAGFFTYLVLRLLDGFFNLNTFFGVLGHGFISGLFGMMAGTLVLYLFHSREYRELISKIK